MHPPWLRGSAPTIPTCLSWIDRRIVPRHRSPRSPRNGQAQLNRGRMWRQSPAPVSATWRLAVVLWTPPGSTPQNEVLAVSRSGSEVVPSGERSPRPEDGASRLYRAVPLWALGLMACAFATVFGLLVAVERLELGIAFAVGVVLLVVTTVGFVAVPQVVAAAAVSYLVLLPMLERFGTAALGGTKDIVTLAAVLASAIVFIERRYSAERATVDPCVITAVGLLLGLYAVDGGAVLAGSGHGWPWFHGVRLVAEPLLLLVAGMMLPHPVRTLRWASVALLTTGVVIAAFGIAQQAIGVDRLLRLGYVYGQEVRQVDGHLRSFGTLDDPFAYASVLLLSLAVLLFVTTLRPRASGAFALLSCGLIVSYVRSAAVGALALVGLALARRGRRGAEILRIAPAALGAIVLFAIILGFSASTPDRDGPTRFLPLQARTELWRQAVGDSPLHWAIGRGVGKVGTAAQRASDSLIRTSKVPQKRGTVVDSSYVVTISDVGVLGLLVLLTLFARLLVLARRAATGGQAAGWLAFGVVTVMLLDGLTRESWTSVPTAYLGMLMVGLAVAAWSQVSEIGVPVRATRQ